MKELIILLFCLATAAGAGAQEFNIVVGGAGNDRGVFATETRDGGFIAVGATEVEDDDVYLVKTDSAGNVVWTNSFGGKAAEWGWSVRETDEGFVVAGSTSSFGAGGFDCYIVGTDSKGNRTWQETYGGANDDHCWAMTRDKDGWVIAGESSRAGEGTQDCFIVAVDSSGKERWSSTFGGDKSDRCFSIQPSGDGWLVAGATFSKGAGDRDLWVVGVGPKGDLLWEKTWGGAASDVAHWIEPNRDGSFLVTGYTSSFAEKGDDPYLVKISPAGEELWTRRLPFDSVVHTITGVERKDGGFCLTGFENTGATRAALFIRTDAEGTNARTQRLRETSGDSFGYTIQATSDGGCILTGHTTQGAVGGRDLLLVKLP